MTSADREISVKTNKPLDGITVITIDRKNRRNAVDAETAQKLYEAILDFERDDLQKVAVLHGANGTFCAGYDLHTVSTTDQSPPSARQSQQTKLEGSMGPMGPSRLRVKKPLICAVSGYAVAGGLELSLLGDIRVVEEDAVFGVFCRRWGVPLIDGGTVRLQAIIGLGHALDMIVTGRPVAAQEALTMGLANRVVQKGKALDEALGIAKQLLQFPQRCMNSDRESCYHACFDAPSFEDALRYETTVGRESLQTEGVFGAQRFSSGIGRHGVFSKL